MHKVMTRTAQHTPTRPPTRRDPRRPGTAAPRGQGGGTPRTTTGEALSGTSEGVGSPLRTAPGAGSAETTTHSIAAGRGAGRTAPVDGRPPAAPGRGTRTPATATTGRAAPRTTPTAAPGRGTTSAALALAPSTPVGGRATDRAEPRTVPAQAAPGGVPQPRPTDVFADRLLAVLSGQRPVHWMLRHTAGRAYDELVRLAEHGPLRATRGTRPVVRDIGYYVARPGAVEAFARIGAGDQLRAMAFRLERGADLRWRCTAVELGGPRAPHTPDDD